MIDDELTKNILCIARELVDCKIRYLNLINNDNRLTTFTFNFDNFIINISMYSVTWYISSIQHNCSMWWNPFTWNDTIWVYANERWEDWVTKEFKERLYQEIQQNIQYYEIKCQKMQDRKKFYADQILRKELKKINRLK